MPIDATRDCYARALAPMDPLDTELTLRCGVAMTDRIAMAPLTNTQSNADGTLNDEEFTWLTRRARDGFCWVSTCAAFVSEQGHAWKGQLGVASEAHEPGLRRLAAGLCEHGAVGVVQLHHGGAKAELAVEKLSTSDDASASIRGATEDDIARVTADFVAAAQRSERAGFAGVEIHGANGYLFTQFLAPKDNPRTDAYGGDLAGRARFLRQTVQAVRAAVSPGFAVGVRISPVDTWARRGLVLADSVELARWLADDGIDFLHLSLRDAAGPAPFEDGETPVARAIRDALDPKVPIFAAGGIWSRNEAHRALAAGVDVAVIGRASIAHPDWPSASAGAGWTPTKPTWTKEHLRSADVGPSLIEYLSGFPGMVEGGTPPRS